jgi:hypothetical protein
MFCRIVFGIDFGVANHTPDHYLPLLLRLAEKLASRITPQYGTLWQVLIPGRTGVLAFRDALYGAALTVTGNC